MYNQTEITLKPSIELAALIAIPYCAALYLLTALKLTNSLTFLLALLILLSACTLIQTTCLLASPRSIQQLSISEKRIVVNRGFDDQYEATLRQAVLTNHLVLLSIDLNDTISDNSFINKYFKQRYILVSRLNTTDLSSFRRFKGLLNLCHKDL